MTPTKIILAFTGMFVLLMVFALQRGKPEPAHAEAEAVFDAAWADSFQNAVLKKTDLKKTDRLPLASITAPEPTPKHPDIVEEPPAGMPPVVVVQDEPTVLRRKHSPASTRHTPASDVCSRHHMHRVETHGGRSWRCRK